MKFKLNRNWGEKTWSHVVGVHSGQRPACSTHQGTWLKVRGRSACCRRWPDTAGPPSPWHRRTPSPSWSSTYSRFPRQKLGSPVHCWLVMKKEDERRIKTHVHTCNIHMYIQHIIWNIKTKKINITIFDINSAARMKYCTSLAGVLHLISIILCTAALRCSTFFKYSFGSSIVLAVVLHFVSTGLLKRRSPFFFQKLEPLSPLHRENGQHCRRRSFLNQEITTRWSQSVVLYIYKKYI